MYMRDFSQIMPRCLLLVSTVAALRPQEVTNNIGFVACFSKCTGKRCVLQELFTQIVAHRGKQRAIRSHSNLPWVRVHTFFPPKVLQLILVFTRHT